MHRKLKLMTLFITGIGTGVGKTIVAAIVAEALHADYWKPIQAGFDNGTDSLLVQSLVTNTHTQVLAEAYKLKLPASPHIAARDEDKKIYVNEIQQVHDEIMKKQAARSNDYLNEYTLICEGAGGIMVPINNMEFVIDLITPMRSKTILVSRNYLGSINHSLLTASISKQYNLDVIGWIFNDLFMKYEEEIVGWTGYPRIGTIPFAKSITKEFVFKQAEKIRPALLTYLQKHDASSS